MTKGEVFLKWSHEARSWVKLLGPYLAAFVTGWHLPTPSYMSKKDGPK